jgi:WD40 repeat protein
VSFGAGGQTIATGWSDGRVRLFRASDGALLEVLEAGRAKVSCLALSADGGLLASGIGGESIRLWRIEERQRRTGGGTRGERMRMS